MNPDDVKLLEENGWTVECESPFEIRYEDGGAFASGLAADLVLDTCKHERNNAFSEQDMHDCFNAGINRGVAIAVALSRRGTDFLEEYPPYKEYMKRYEDQG